MELRSLPEGHGGGGLVSEPTTPISENVRPVLCPHCGAVAQKLSTVGWHQGALTHRHTQYACEDCGHGWVVEEVTARQAQTS